jgi:hypothetical protein
MQAITLIGLDIAKFMAVPRSNDIDPARGGYAHGTTWQLIRTAGPVSTHSHFRDGILRGGLHYYGDFRFCHKADIQATRTNVRFEG